MGRWLDLTYLFYFASHIIATLIIDAIPIYPSFLVPRLLIDINTWYIEFTKDPLLTKGQWWFKSFLFSELFFQLPFFFLALVGLWKDSPKIRLPLLVYSVHVGTTTWACLSEILLGENDPAFTNEKRYFLASVYFPYLILPIVCGTDSYLRIRKTEKITWLEKNK
ncbi:hypothetical protein G9A89_004692 [Geosiphon pyriformis]|nr:hypothetical protein G9A89_004692 [Geosiphon pyriformis]